jgi:predicted transcriptional regulator
MPNWAEIVLEVFKEDKITCTKICKNVVVTYSHISNIVKYLEKEGIVIKSKGTRECYISLTENGKIVAESLIKIKNIIDLKSRNSVEPDKTPKTEF